jgi:hypothetical protein
MPSIVTKDAVNQCRQPIKRYNADDSLGGESQSAVIVIGIADDNSADHEEDVDASGTHHHIRERRPERCE